MNYIDVRAEKLSSTAEEKERWRELLQNLEKAQRQMSDPDKIVTEYFGVEVAGSRCVPNNQNRSDCLFRKSLKAFRALYERTHPTKQEIDSCDLLVSMVGFSLEPVMHTVLTLRPKHVIFVFSKDSARFRPRVKTLDYLKVLISCHGEGYNPKIEQITLESTDTALVFSSVHNAIAQASKSGSVAIDVTGGKKSMDVSAFLAASLFEKVAIYYVDYEEYDSATGYPVWGSEFLNELDNPYKLFNVREEHLIKEYWDKGDFAAAKRLAEMIAKVLTPEIAERYSISEKRNRLVEIGKAAACYELWSRFDYKAAKSSFFADYDQHHNGVLDELDKCSMVFVEGECCRRENAEIALMLAVDRYSRGFDAMQFKEWNRAALCYMQATEALLRFSYSLSEESVLRSKSQEYYSSPLLKKLFGFRYNNDKKEMEVDSGVNNPVFKNDDLCKRLQKSVLNKRNELSHYECVLHSGESDVIEGMIKDMGDVVKDFLKLFAENYKIEENYIDAFCTQVAFLQLDNDLQFMTSK